MRQRKPRLLILAAQYFPAVGGSEVQARLLAREFKRRELRVEVWTRRLDAGQPVEEEIDALRVRRLGPIWALRPPWVRRLERAGFVARLYRELRASVRQFDIAFANQLENPATLAVLARRPRGGATVARMAASGLLVRKGLGPRSHRSILVDGLSRVVALGPITRLECERAGFPAARVAMISNAVSTNRDSEPPPRDDLPLRAVWLGRFRPEKRADMALLAWTEARLPGTLAVVGDGDQRDSVALLVARCRERKGPDSVEMTGLIEDPRGEVSKSHIFIQSSDTEGMSNALLEAMGSGCACVATDVGETRFVLGGETAPEVSPGQFVEAEAGLLVRPSDVSGLTRALDALGDPGMRARLGTAARLRCALNHGIDGIVERYLQLFQEIMEKPGG